MKGNKRYVEGEMRRHDFKREREHWSGGQNPYAGILSCADSRIAPEYAFDSGRGDLFVCRVAGNFANDDTVASMEYTVAMLNTPLIMVLGHDSCGAVDATIKSLKDKRHPCRVICPLWSPASRPPLRQFRGNPAIPSTMPFGKMFATMSPSSNSATPILSAAVEQGKLKVVGGIYRLKDGRVEMIS